MKPKIEPEIDSKIDDVIIRAEQICQSSGSRLTDKRKRILEIILRSSVPMSAYEVADAYNRHSETSMPPMSVYRILDFLVSEELAHKLASANKYIACSHIACQHSHEIPQFLICRTCHKVKEIAIKKAIVEELRNNVGSVGYKLMNSQLELDCLCEQCATNAA